MKLVPAQTNDAQAIAELQCAVADHLTAAFGPGPWSSRMSERGVLSSMKGSRVYIARERGRVIASLRLTTTKPWAIDRRYFTSIDTPLYLLDMAVHPDRQRRGLGRKALAEAARLAREWPANAICLDAWDAPAGAGEFYRKCGFEERGRVTYRDAPLIYLELLI
jgi:GNAT superfamily N-acetyltransferase